MVKKILVSIYFFIDGCQRMLTKVFYFEIGRPKV